MVSDKKLTRCVKNYTKHIRNYFPDTEKTITNRICNRFGINRNTRKKIVYLKVIKLIKPLRLEAMLLGHTNIALSEHKYNG